MSDDPKIVVEALKEPAKPITESFVATRGDLRRTAIPIGATSLGELEKDAKRRGGALDVIPGASPSDAVIYFNGQGESVLFARPQSNSYRNSVVSGR